MSGNNKIKVSITPTWDIVKKINDQIKDLLIDPNPKDLERITMVVTELVENAVKYGESTTSCRGIDFEIDITDSDIIIVVSNGVKTSSNAEIVIEHIKKIQSCDDPATLYTERLMELMENPEAGVSQLGLYRIGYEGGFNLDYQFENEKLVITASSKI